MTGKEVVFQCPTSGFLLFYCDKIGGDYMEVKCFNALPRAFFFSTLSVWLPAEKKWVVSMPYLGLSSFLRYVSASLEFTGFANPFLRVII